MLGLAARQDAILSNPIREAAGIHNPNRNARALSITDVQNLRAWAKAWQESPGHEGRPRAPELLETVDVFLSTAARIGEVLALRSQDVDLDAERPSLTISGTVTRYKGQPLFHQDRTKTAAGYRTMALPRFVVEDPAAASCGTQSVARGLPVTVSGPHSGQSQQLPPAAARCP